MSFIFQVLAKNPPSILFVIGAFLMLSGAASGNNQLVNFGWSCIGIGAVLQVIYLLLRYKAL